MKINFPEIVTFRITSRCNQRCRFCYGPKNIPALKLNELKIIFKKLFDYGVRGMVLTGGEPLMRCDIEKILVELKKYNFKIFLDTNGDLFFKYQSSINRFVDVLGLPMDASSEQRAYRRHNLVNVLNALASYRNSAARPRIKVGTVVTKENVDELTKIAELLKQLPVDIWKLYQFIPSGQVADQNKKKLLMADKTFFGEANKIVRGYNRFFEILVSPRRDRASAYFLINPDGQVIMPVERARQCQEIAVGHILDDDIAEKWQKIFSPRNYLDNTETTFAHEWNNFPMKPIYNKIWQIARRYNQNGQQYTADHIAWHIKEALSIMKRERLDEAIFMPFIILHDVGYSATKGGNPFTKYVRQEHMKAGQSIAEKILNMVDYPAEKTKKISSYVSVHDRWALGDHQIYRQDKILGIFNDLDYISMFSRPSFSFMAKIFNQDAAGFIDHLEQNEKLRHRPFLVQSTKNLYQQYLDRKRQEVLAI